MTSVTIIDSLSRPIMSGMIARVYRIINNNRAFGRAIKLFAEASDLWKCGVYYHLEIQGNPLNARQLMLKALFFNPKSTDLWSELLCLDIRMQLLILQREKIADQVLKEKKQDQKIIEEQNLNSNNAQLELETGIIESESEEEIINSKNEQQSNEDSEANEDSNEEFIGFDEDSQDEMDQQTKENDSDLQREALAKKVQFAWILEEIWRQFKDDQQALAEIVYLYKEKAAKIQRDLKSETRSIEFINICISKMEEFYLDKGIEFEFGEDSLVNDISDHQTKFSNRLEDYLRSNVNVDLSFRVPEGSIDCSDNPKYKSYKALSGEITRLWLSSRSDNQSTVNKYLSLKEKRFVGFVSLYLKSYSAFKRFLKRGKVSAKSVDQLFKYSKFDKQNFQVLSFALFSVLLDQSYLPSFDLKAVFISSGHKQNIALQLGTYSLLYPLLVIHKQLIN